MKFELAGRVKSLTPSTTLAITAKAKELKSQGLDVIGLGAGEPDFNTPQHIIDAAVASMNEGQTKYTPAAGLPALKKKSSKSSSRTKELTIIQMKLLLAVVQNMCCIHCFKLF